MSIASVFEGWLPAVGGLLGLATIIYFALMLHYTRKGDDRLQRIEVVLARLEGLSLGRRKR